MCSKSSFFSLLCCVWLHDCITNYLPLLFPLTFAIFGYSTLINISAMEGIIGAFWWHEHSSLQDISARRKHQVIGAVRCFSRWFPRSSETGSSPTLGVASPFNSGGLWCYLFGVLTFIIVVINYAQDIWGFFFLNYQVLFSQKSLYKIFFLFSEFVWIFFFYVTDL